MKTIISPRARRLALAACAVAMLGAPCGSAQALMFRHVPALEKIAADAPLAFRGRVEAIEYRTAKTGNGKYPYVVTTFRVLAGYRGASPGDEIRIARLGGPIDGDMRRYLIVPGVPGFTPGDEVVVFQNDAEHPFFGAAYGDRGVLRIARTPDGQRRVLNFHGQPLTRDGELFGIDRTTVCAVRQSSRDVCDLRATTADASFDEDAATKATEPVTPAKFDDAMRRIVSDYPLAAPAQTVSGDAARFEAALADLAARGGRR